MQRRLAENKRSIAIIVALAILLITALSDVFISRLENKSLKNEERMSRFLDEFLGGKSQELILQGTDRENRIAVLPIKGVITSEDSRILQEASTVNQLDAIMEDQSVRGLLLEIDSPGGTVYESARIWEKIKEVQEKREIPIYSSMGSVAASGGYYVAAPSDKIFAAEETITGSIGVIADYVNITELEEKLGIKHEIIKSGEFKDIGSMSREMSEEEREINQSQVDEFFNKFVKVIAEGRQMTEKKVRSLSDGRVYTGKQAVENGLVDQIGYYDDALKAMISDLAIEDPEVFRKVADKSPFSQFIGVKSQETDGKEKQLETSFEGEAFKYIEENHTQGNLPEFYYLYGGI